MAFLGMLLSGAIFMASATFFRLVSIWNENKRRFIIAKDKVLLNVWNSRKASDFLHYLKFEFVQYTYHGAMMITCILVMPGFNKNGDNSDDDFGKDWESIDDTYNFANLMFALSALLEIILLRYLLSQAMGGSASNLSRVVYKTIISVLLLCIIGAKVYGCTNLIINWNELHLF